MKKFFNRKIIITFFIILGIMLLVASALLYLFLTREKVIFKLVGEKSITLNVYEQYNELGFVASINKKDISQNVVVDTSNLDSNKLGTYEITYKMNYEDKEIILTRKVEVVDTIAPTITLKGEKEVTVIEGNVYQDLGCIAVDNFDEKVNNKVQVINRVNTQISGIYEVIYNVVDESGNKALATRKVIVKPKDLDNSNNYLDLMTSNQVTEMHYIDEGIFIEGYVKDNKGSFRIKLCEDNKESCISYNMNKKDEYYYNGNIKLSNLDKGIYYMWIESKIDEKVVNKIDMQYRIARSKIGDKLITFNYEHDNVKVIVDDFEYKYDILIDPGHGGTDPGASNSVTSEKSLNLMQSLYEKKRYEEHGLKVLLLREDESYGMTMGDSAWPPVRKKAYALGFYGVVSKITYSNHHNSSDDLSMSGWEIIVPADANKEELQNVYTIREQWIKNYNVLDNHVRIYTRNYTNGVIFTKENEEEYYFTDYYAVIRLPYQLFHIKNVLFEGAYLSNMKDFNWYYNNDNWKNLSEAKIKTYVESLGVKYIEP